MTSNPTQSSDQARQLLIQELFMLTGADALNLIQHRRQLEAMDTTELVRMKDEMLETVELQN